MKTIWNSDQEYATPDSSLSHTWCPSPLGFDDSSSPRVANKTKFIENSPKENLFELEIRNSLLLMWNAVFGGMKGQILIELWKSGNLDRHYRQYA